MAIYEYESEKIKPVAKIEEYLALRTPKGVEKYFKINRIEPIPGFIDDFGNYISGFAGLAPNATEKLVAENVKKILAADTNQLFQYRLIPLDDYWYRYKQYGDRFKLKNKQTWITKDIVSEQPELAEWFVYEENVPEIWIYNPTTDTLTTLRFKVYGFVYELEEVTEKPPKATYIPIYAEI